MELPEIFSGEDGTDFHQWIRRFELSTEVSGISDKNYLLLPARLSGPAFIVWEGLPESEKKDFTKIKEKLSAVFGKTHFLQTFRSCITARKRHQSEPLEVYASTITAMVEEAFPKYDADAKEGESFRRFIAGLEENLRTKIIELGGATLKDALDIALRVERANQQVKAPSIAALSESKQDTLYLQILKRLDALEKKMDSINLNDPPRSQAAQFPSQQPHSSNPGIERRGRSPNRHPDFQRPRQGYQSRSPSPRAGHQQPRNEYQSRSPSRQVYQPPKREYRDYRHRSPSPQSRQPTCSHHYYPRDQHQDNNPYEMRSSPSYETRNERLDDRRVHFSDHKSGNFY